MLFPFSQTALPSSLNTYPQKSSAFAVAFEPDALLIELK
jgi:hypothetical protein